MDKITRAKLEEMVELLNSGMNKKEFLKAFESVVKQIKDLEVTLIKKNEEKTESAIDDLNNLKEEFRNALVDVQKEKDSTLGGIKRRIIDAIENSFIKSNVKGRLEDFIKGAESRIAGIKPKKGDDGKTPTQEELLELIKPLIPEPVTNVISKELVFEDVRNILEIETVEEEKLSISAIGFLRQELDELKSLVKSGSGGGFQGGIIGKNLITDIDISAQLDGVTKTFNIPAIYNIISVHLSSFPHALRKTIDFTYTQTSITFTSEINADSSLATGQTCVLTVVQNT